MAVILLVVAFGGIVLFEVPGLIQKQYWRELIAFSVLLSAGFVLSLLMALGVELPNISVAITELVKAIFPGLG